MPVEKLLLRIPEAAEAVGLGRSKFYQLLAAGQLPVVRFGRAARVPAEALRDWVAERVKEAEVRDDGGGWGS